MSNFQAVPEKEKEGEFPSLHLFPLPADQTEDVVATVEQVPMERPQVRTSLGA